MLYVHKTYKNTSLFHNITCFFHNINNKKKNRHLNSRHDMKSVQYMMILREKESERSLKENNK